MADKRPFAEQLADRTRPYFEQVVVSSVEQAKTLLEDLFSKIELDKEEKGLTMADVRTALQDELDFRKYEGRLRTLGEKINSIENAVSKLHPNATSNFTNPKEKEALEETHEAVIRNAADVEKSVAGKVTVLQQVSKLLNIIDEQNQDSDEDTEKLTAELERKSELDAEERKKLHSSVNKLTSKVDKLSNKFKSFWDRVKELVPVIAFGIIFWDEIVETAKSAFHKLTEEFPALKRGIDSTVSFVKNTIDKLSPILDWISEKINPTRSRPSDVIKGPDFSLGSTSFKEAHPKAYAKYQRKIESMSFEELEKEQERLKWYAIPYRHEKYDMVANLMDGHAVDYFEASPKEMRFRETTYKDAFKQYSKEQDERDAVFAEEQQPLLERDFVFNRLSEGKLVPPDYIDADKLPDMDMEGLSYPEWKEKQAERWRSATPQQREEFYKSGRGYVQSGYETWNAEQRAAAEADWPASPEELEQWASNPHQKDIQPTTNVIVRQVQQVFNHQEGEAR